ncbi:Kef-type K+ transport system membrane component KefB [Chitinophaga skermanii]|uniref:Kef-type K+ transport system membrane component KefB n=1 Tax=Chitinophaga skermanii TaxID=331697 RepID=A0A327QK74_9BACT|nr:cation:proton antiporter [Chitinophaga skermanii]RAJ04275.1 Kef-type K+ transport system membrane component KefB [Chitinophaga skermanii]
MKKNYWIYPLIICIFSALIWFIIYKGEMLSQLRHSLPAEKIITPEQVAKAAPAEQEGFLSGLLHHAQLPISILLLQIIVVLSVARAFGWAARKIGQPAVVGEIIAGIVLGPSLLGLIAPDVMKSIFPTNTLSSLQFLSQIGLAFFMFIVGMELDIAKIKNKAHDAVVISHASIIIPFFLGVSLAYFIYEDFAPVGISFLAFSLFMGIAMSVTAFPVLARIVQERKLTGTPLGTLAITCAAADDVTAWCILAVVVAIAKAASIVSALLTIILAAVFVAAMLYVVQPWVGKRLRKYAHAKDAKKTIALAFFVLLGSAYVAEVIGIHALFGAFLAGVIMPQTGNFKSILTDKLEDVSVLMLLPIFFAFTGLRTQIGLLNEGHLWAVFGMIMLVAVGGKFAGSTLTAKAMGQNWTDAISIGALMNTRGLMELIVLNIGYDLGILSAQMFAMLVLMALATTFMTGPALDIVNYVTRKKSTVVLS